MTTKSKVPVTRDNLSNDGRGQQYVFGYGSLLERWHGAPQEAQLAPTQCELSDYRRTWNVAMDNSRTIAGYKYYVDPISKARRDWFVVFLNIVPSPGAHVNGLLFETDDKLLSKLDARERNYERVDVSHLVSPTVAGTIWTYVGTPAAVDRFEAGCRTNRAVISREYHDGVVADFARLGADAVARFQALTDPPPCPVIDLVRVNLSETTGDQPGPDPTAQAPGAVPSTSAPDR
jgi:cation transport regulator ChaC